MPANDTIVHYAFRTTDGTFFQSATRGRIRGIYITPSTSDGSVVLHETDSEGEILCRFDTAGGNRAIDGPSFPGYGIAFRQNVYLDTTSINFVGIFYSEDRA